jgi:uncharacterized protein (DUF885 family)
MRVLLRYAALTLTLAVTSLALGAEPAWVTRSNLNATALLQLMAKYSPESASQFGVDGYDEAILDLSRDQFQSTIRDYRALIADYEHRLASEKDARIRQDLEILIGSARDTVSSTTLNRKYFFPFIDASGLIYGVLQQTIDPRIPLARQQTVVKRLEKYAGMAPGYHPITELAKQRTLARMQADAKLLGPYRGEAEQVIANHVTFLKGARELLTHSQVRGWEPSFALLETQLNDYNTWLTSTILPRARADYRLPPEVYADNLHVYGVDIAPEELISRALTSFAEIRTQLIITAGLVARQHGWPDTDYHAVVRKLKEQQIPADQIMNVYRERLSAIEDAVRANRIVSLPTRAAAIRLATPAENAQTPAPHMNPPRLLGNTGEYGEFVLSTGLPPDASGKTPLFDDFSHQAISWTLTAHEARPGHELQFAKMIESGVSTARAVFAFNSTNAEGWALYAESEMQPYEPLDGQLFTLLMRAHRAARAFLDPMVNLGQITPEEVKSFLMEEVCYSDAFATSEMQRYTFRTPGQATSYFYGYQRLMEIRQAAQLALRGKFDRMAYNDFVLSQGLVPPRLLRKAVMEEFVPAHR